MDFMVCVTGEPAHLDGIPAVEKLGAGFELQSYGLKGASSPEAWQKRLDTHRTFRSRYSGKLALHGPFIGISYAFFDHLLVGAVKERMRLTLEAVRELKASRLILHTGYKPDVNLFGIEKIWLDSTVRFWKEESKKYADLGVEVVLENLIEPDPGLMARLHDAVAHDSFKLCLDVGHVNVWGGGSPARWIEAWGHRLRHVHLHDNHGKTDEHLPPGQGTLDFTALFASLRTHSPDATVSLEVEAEPDTVLRSLEETVTKYGP